MTEDLTFRCADHGDLAPLLALYEHLNPGDPSIDPKDARDILDRLCQYDGSAVLLGLRDGVVVTTCTLIVIPNLTRAGAPYALIENVVTHPDHRKRGYGKAILTEAIAAAWRHGCYKVMLLTGSRRPATLKFYTDVGFEQTKTGFQVRRVAARAD